MTYVGSRVSDPRTICVPVHAAGTVPPGQAVPLGALRPLETALAGRGLVARSDGFPLWFLAETERNVFLWRNGSSILEADDFDFWVDLPALVAKRRSQLAAGSSWGPELGGGVGVGLGSDEAGYLDDVEQLLPEVLPHLHALGQAVRLAGSDVRPPVVVLPVPRTRPPSVL